MDEQRIITGATEDEIWSQLEADLNSEEDVLTYDAIIEQGDKSIELYIDIDPGGGFESGYELTQLIAPVHVGSEFKFAIHDEGFADEIGKFFGMQDIVTGYPDLDKHVVIKSNHEETVKRIFADPEIRQVFTDLDDFDFGIHTHSDDPTPVLELNINEGILDAESLRRVYNAFYTVLTAIEG